jgi:hypothetical protein
MDEWRYIRYADGGEELYDRTNDPNEWENLAGKTEFDTAKRDLRHLLPQQNAAPVRAKKEYDFDAQRYEWHLRS